MLDFNLVNRKSLAARFCAIFLVAVGAPKCKGLKLAKTIFLLMLDLNFSLQPRRKQGFDSKALPEFGRFRK